MSKSILSPDATWLEIHKPDAFQHFFQEFSELLKRKLQRKKVGGSGHYYYSCGQIHDHNNRNWEPFFHLWSYTVRKQLHFYVVKDLIEEHLGRELECECEILGDKKAIRRRMLGKQFGLDFSELGDGRVDIV